MARTTRPSRFPCPSVSSLAPLVGTLLLYSAAPAAASIVERHQALLEPSLGTAAQTVDTTLEFDVFTVKLQGELHALAAPREAGDASPGSGPPVGWHFSGTGVHTVTPITNGEWKSLAFRSGIDDFKTLRTTFSEALLWLDPQHAARLLEGASAREAGSSAEQSLDSLLANTHDTPFADLPLRVLAALENDTLATKGTDFFYLLTDSSDPGPSLLALDGRGVLDGEEAALYVFAPPGVDDEEEPAEIESDLENPDSDPGFWYSSRRREMVEAGLEYGEGSTPLVDVARITLHSVISRDTDLEGQAEIEAVVTVPEARVLPFEITPTLRVSEVAVRAGSGDSQRAVSAQIVQRPPEEGTAAALLLEEPLLYGEPITIEMRYAGDGVLVDDGVRTYRVQSRAAWYPNLNGHSDPSHFDLTFEVPKNNTVVAVGKPISSRNQGDRVVSQWTTDTEIRLAGFNYGAFKLYEVEEENTGFDIEVHASLGVPDIITEINSILRSQSAVMTPDQAQAVAATDFIGIIPSYRGATDLGVSMEGLAQGALADAQNAVQIFTAQFGPSPFQRLAITQQAEWTFGQAWPGLIYLPYAAAFSTSARSALGLHGMASFIDEVGIHEVAHQWWGHLIGWKTYRDQWISEGFAEFSTALVLEATQGQDAYDAFWHKRRRNVLSSRYGRPASWAGPITLGHRANSARSPFAYQGLAYAKGGFVLHMLRQLMREPSAPNPDAAFFAMLRDFAQSNAGKAVSTSDFRATVQKHFVPQLNAHGDGRVDWFFDQWVYGRAIPTIESDLSFESAGRGKFRVYGSVAQSNVPEDFVTIVPLYADLGKGGIGSFGRLAFKGEMKRDIDTVIEFPRKPRALMANYRNEVLAYDE